MDAHWWIQQVTTRVGAVTCWIQQPVSPKQVVGFTCVFNSEVDQFIRKFVVLMTVIRSLADLQAWIISAEAFAMEISFWSKRATSALDALYFSLHN